MKPTFLSLFVILVFSSPAFAQITDPKVFFTSMCITEKSTGFNWKQGRWEYTRFKETKYIIEKLQPEEFKTGASIPKSGDCKSELEKKDARFFDDWGYSYGCYNLREFGDPFYSHRSHVCSERWKGKAPNRALESVDCVGSPEPITFAPNGWFHRASIHGYIENRPKDDYKDSLAVEVGKCAVIGK